MMGHGHVIPNPNGAKARCGGPALCAECALELAGRPVNEVLAVFNAVVPPEGGRLMRDPFIYHPPTKAQADRMQAIRDHARSLRDLIEELAPACADRTVAIRALREVTYNANCAIILSEDA